MAENLASKSWNAKAIAQARSAIERDGFTMVMVPEKNYLYTVGLTAQGYPELVALGVSVRSQDLAFQFIGFLATSMASDEIKDGDVVEYALPGVDQLFRFRLTGGDDPKHPLTLALKFYDDVKALVVEPVMMKEN